MTVFPAGSRSRLTARKIRKSASSRCRTLTAAAGRSGDPDRHQEIAKLLIFRAAYRRRARGVRRLDDDLVAGDGLDTVDEVRRVKRDDKVLAGVVPVHGLCGGADILALDTQVHATLAHGEPDRGRVVAHEQLHPAQ